MSHCAAAVHEKKYVTAGFAIPNDAPSGDVTGK